MKQLDRAPLKIRNLVLYPNGFTNLSDIWNQDFLGDDASYVSILRNLSVCGSSGATDLEIF